MQSEWVLKLKSNNDILELCAALTTDAQLNKAERVLLSSVTSADPRDVNECIHLIKAGQDPLGDAFMRVNGADERRSSGSVYTPFDTIELMLRYARTHKDPARIVDCGCGSGRFALAAARMFPHAHVIAIDSSAMATLMCKANAHAAGLTIDVLQGDFMHTHLPPLTYGSTLWIGNPPYVRHHDLTRTQKEWLASTLKELGVRGNALAGLHAYFVASIAKRFGPSDMGCLILSAEWMDTTYGVIIRDILSRTLALRYMKTYDKTEQAFEGAQSSAVIVGFAANNPQGIVRVNDKSIPLMEFASSSRWSDVVEVRQSAKTGDGYVRLGEFARVHRGVVTGKNGFWVRKPGEVSEQLCTPIVSHARELTGNEPAYRDVSRLARLITLPADLSQLPEPLHAEAQGIIAEGLEQGIDEGFVASHRKSWWSIKAPEPPAIMMTYMARHSPTFVINTNKLGMLNVVHGIYPTVELSDRALANLTNYLNRHVDVRDGRTYSGGLTKFEPREVERLVVPSPERLEM